jgi:hypothetical protein
MDRKPAFNPWHLPGSPLDRIDLWVAQRYWVHTQGRIRRGNRHPLWFKNRHGSRVSAVICMAGIGV